MSLLRAATLVTPDLAATAALYGRWMGYEVVEQGLIAPDLAAAWGASGSAGRSYVVMQPASGAPVFLRLVQGKAPGGYRALRTYGWAAVEFCVTDVLAVESRLRSSPFEVIGAPQPLEGLPMIFPMQVKGPDQEVFFLTQITGPLPGFDLPRAQSLVDRPFIMVLACSDLTSANAWIERALPVTASPPMELAYGVLSHAFDLDPGHKHRIATLAHGRDVFLETDQYPAEATPRPRHPEELPPGVALVTFETPTFDESSTQWIAPPRVRHGVLYGGARTATAIGPDGALFELIERS